MKPFLFVLLAASLSFAAPEPQDLVTIRGTVTDKTQAVVPGAAVRLEDADGHVVRSTTANEVGEFRIENVPSGDYFLRVDLKGFESKTQKIAVMDGRAIVATVELEAGKVTESVTVTADALYTESQAITATKMNVPLLDVPQSVAVVNNQLLRAQGARSVEEALRNVPGVSVQLGEGRRDHVSIRGFSALNDQYVDGVRDDSPYYRDLSSVERYEVLKGPGAVLYGRGSAGGIINRVMKRAEIAQPANMELATTFGSYGQKRTSTDMGSSFFNDKLALRLTGAYEDSNSFRHFYGLNRYDLSPSLAWKVSDATTLNFQMEHLYDSRLPDRGIPSLNGRPAPVDIHTYYGYPEDDFIRNRVNTQSLSVEHRFAHWVLRNAFRHSGYDNIFSNTQPNGIDNAGMVKREQYNVNSGQSNLFNQTDAIFGGRFAGLMHSSLLGMEIGRQSRDTARFTGTAASVALVDPVLTQPVYATTPATNNQFTGTTVGVYFNDQISIRPKWKASVGVRFDHYEQSLDDRRPANNDLARTDNAFSPRAGVVYQPKEWASIYASYSRSFSPSGDGLSLAVNNQQLEPETTENYEVGSKFELFQRKLSTTFAVFRLNRSNVKTVDPNDSSKLVLSGEQRTNGFEWSFSGSVKRGWDFYGGYAYLGSRIVRANDATLGNRIAHVAPHAVNLWSTYEFRNGFGFGGGVIYNDDRFANNDNAVLIPEFTRADATMFWKKPAFEVVLNLRNVGNTRYYESAQNNHQILPGAPVNGSVTMRYRWGNR